MSPGFGSTVGANSTTFIFVQFVNNLDIFIGAIMIAEYV